VITLAYVTYQDIRKISGLKDQTVIVVKAPPETRLEVPDPVEVRRTWLFLPAYISFFYGLRTCVVSLTGVTDAQVGLYWHTVLYSSVLQTLEVVFFKRKGNL